MSGARDVIARILADCEPTIASTVPLPHAEVAEHVVAALAAAGLSITETSDEWEWGVRWATGSTEKRRSREEAQALRRDYPNYVRSALRRRPAGPWEVAP